MRFFLYGTLISATDTRMARWLAPRLGETIRASVPGRLYAIRSPGGWYPALLRGRNEERTWGLVCDASLGPGDLARLDRYEGVQYRRASALARTIANQRLTVRLYRWHASLPHGAQLIRSGDFLSWLADTGRVPFSDRRDGR